MDQACSEQTVKLQHLRPHMLAVQIHGLILASSFSFQVDGMSNTQDITDKFLPAVGAVEKVNVVECQPPINKPYGLLIRGVLLQ